jgi:hypothetical protein
VFYLDFNPHTPSAMVQWQPLHKKRQNNFGVAAVPFWAHVQKFSFTDDDKH